MGLILGLVGIFIILPAFFLLIFVYIPSTLRSYRLHRLADEFELTFNNGMKKFSFSPIPESYKRNILTGNINSHSVEVFDFYEFHLGLSYYFGNRQESSFYLKFTVLIVDGQETKLSGYIGFPSVRKIRKHIIDIQKA